MHNIIVSAQMGAAGNLVKNIIQLSENIWWPKNTDRKALVDTQYPKLLATDRQTWTRLESVLHATVKNPFLVDFDAKNNCVYEKPAVFVNHSLFWNWPTDFDTTKNNFCFLFVMPLTRFGLEWQCRAAFEKVIDPNQDKFYDFCYDGADKQQKINEFIKQHGLQAYQKQNIINMREILWQQQQTVMSKVNRDSVIALEDLLLCPAKQVIEMLHKNIDIELDHCQVEDVLAKWRQLHWPLNQTYNWKYSV